MEEKRLQSIGIDLSSDFASVACLEAGSSLPVSMSVRADDEKYVIPLVLYKKRNMTEWLIGDEALSASENESNGRENLAEQLFLMYEKKEVMYIEDKEYSGEELLKKYILLLFDKIAAITGFSEAETIVFTTEKLDAGFVRTIRQIYRELDMDSRLCLLSHTEAFAAYVLCNKKELWANDVSLFFMDKNKFFCQTMTVRREKNKSTVFVEEEDLSGLAKYTRLTSEKLIQEADEAFLQYLKEDYKTHIVSSVFFTGIGFYENWCKKCLAEICRKRKAFKGLNLYSDGAAASVLLEKRTDLVLYCHGRTLVNIGVVRIENGEEKDYLLSEAGINWTEAEKRAEFLVDSTDCIKLAITSPFYPGRQILEISLEEFPNRRDKTMFLEISLIYENENNFEIAVEDKGFGDFYPSSGKIIKKRISL